jgi:polar amino acid transport system substrate-binding protein
MVRLWTFIDRESNRMSRVSRITASAFLFVLASSVSHAAGVTPPADIAKAGKITFCSDISSPPLEYFDEASKAVGSDVDIGTEIATRMGVKAEFKNTAFSAIIPTLQAKQCDAILSQLFDKPKRREVVDFVDYMYSSQAFLTAKGNPKNIKGLDDISGLKVAIENGTTIQDLVVAQNEKFKAAGKPEATAIIFPKDTDAIQALQAGQVDLTSDPASLLLSRRPWYRRFGSQSRAKSSKVRQPLQVHNIAPAG